MTAGGSSQSQKYQKRELYYIRLTGESDVPKFTFIADRNELESLQRVGHNLPDLMLVREASQQLNGVPLRIELQKLDLHQWQPGSGKEGRSAL